MTDRRGSTLLEVVVGVAIFTILVTLSSSIFLRTWESYLTVKAQADTRVRLVSAGDRLTQTLATATALPNTATVAGITYTAGPATLIARLPGIDAAGAALAGVADTVIYTQTSEGLIEVLAPGNGSARMAHNQLVLPGSAAGMTVTITPPGGTAIHTLLTVELRDTAVLPRSVMVLRLTRSLALRNL